MKIFVYNLREHDEKAYFDHFCKSYDCEYAYTTEYPTLENVYLAEGCDALNIITSRIDAPLLEAFQEIGIKYITTRTIGYDHIDVEKAESLGMKVANISYSPNSVANYAIMLMLMSCRNITHILERTKLQDYTLKGKIGKELSISTVGVIGTGKIGRTVIEHLQGFGCKILAYDKYPNAELAKIVEYVELDTLLGESDILTLHAPLTEETYHLIDEQSIAKMKDGVILINTARGGLIDTTALINGLDQHKIGYAALDVLEKEDGLYYFDRMNEPIGNHELAILNAYPNVIITPHTAFYTTQAVSDMVENSIKGIVAFMEESE